MADGLTGMQQTEIAAAAKCSPRTVDRFLKGKRVVPAIEAAIVRAMKTRGLSVPAKVKRPVR